MIKFNKIFSFLILIIFLILLILNQIILDTNVTSKTFLMVGVLLALFRAMFFRKFFKLNIFIAIIMFLSFSIYTKMHSTDSIALIVLTKYAIPAQVVVLVCILSTVITFINIPNVYILNGMVYIFISIFMIIEYIPNVINIFELINYMIFIITYQIIRKVNFNDKK